MDHPIGEGAYDLSPGQAAGRILRIRRGVGLIVEITTPELLPDLVRRLAEHGCMTHAIDDRVCRIVHLGAADPDEEWHEVRFFVRAWQARHGVEATFSPA
jgi:hypothetical protein